VELNLAAPNGRIRLTSADTTYLETYLNRLAISGTANNSSVMYSGVGTGTVGVGAVPVAIVITFPNVDYNDFLGTRTLLFPTRGVYTVNFYITWPATAVDVAKRINFRFREASGGTIVHQQTALGYYGAWSSTIMTPCFPGLLLFDLEIDNVTGGGLTFTCQRCVVSMQYERT
jgi:hypothetical protein